MIGIVGGTGDFGQGLAARLRALGEEVVVGSRTPREELVANAEACRSSELVFLAVPAESAEAMAGELAAELAGKVLVSVAASVAWRPGELSLAERTARAAPQARVVAGFHTVGARVLQRLEHALDEDVLVCGDDAEAKESVLALGDRLVAGRAVDCGKLSAARRLETLTGLIVGINKRYRTNAGVRITGLG